MTGSTSPIIRVPYKEAYPEGGFEDMRRRVPCLCKIELVTGWSPRTSIDEMISKTVRSRLWRPELALPSLAVPGESHAFAGRL